MTKNEESKALWVMVALIIGLAIGFFSARARYKPQIDTLYNMVKEQDWQISKLKGLPVQNPIPQPTKK